MRLTQEEKRSMVGTVSGDFRKIDNSDLEPIAVVAQCLDNQWVPRELLTKMIKQGWSLNHRKVVDRRRSASRHEYLRSILNAQQVIVNRAFFYNNPVVYQDFLRDGRPQEAFRNLLDQSVIIPYLYNETSPIEEQEFTTQPEGWQAWLRVAGETRSSCLRLSWDNDDDNAAYTREYLNRPFRRFLMSMADLEEEGLMQDFGLDEEGASQLKSRLREVSAWAVYNASTREEFYREFVVAEGTKPADGCFDKTKQFAGQIKQLADLRYNSNLADAVDRYPMTPVDSLHRTALQEGRVGRPPVPGAEQEEFLNVLLRRQAFALMQGALDVGLTGLDLHHVQQARTSDEWTAYTTSLTSLINSPEEFENLGQDVYNKYIALATTLSSIVGDRRVDTVDRWEPIIRVSVETIGAVISVVFDTEPYVEVIGEVAQAVAARASTAVVRFAVVGRDQRRADTQLGTSVDLMRIRFDRTERDWKRLIGGLGQAGYPVLEQARRSEVDANLDMPEKSEDNE
ncbi:hypothetical protein [Actinomadura rudentiformis]|uniref:Uncharacterized protein n=1 Tax=Actinomadura rudentiformis TaxID=359158 RepID=A0A6H9YR24_9ACTN|nr:hypothetical protein [Actinomadura rudentiformis]KAB2347771.1 hypothetical protein F8566_17875 [Actinomadura rudentiformis]